MFYLKSESCSLSFGSKSRKKASFSITYNVDGSQLADLDYKPVRVISGGSDRGSSSRSDYRRARLYADLCGTEMPCVLRFGIIFKSRLLVLARAIDSTPCSDGGVHMTIVPRANSEINWSGVSGPFCPTMHQIVVTTYPRNCRICQPVSDPDQTCQFAECLFRSSQWPLISPALSYMCQPPDYSLGSSHNTTILTLMFDMYSVVHRRGSG